MKIDNDLKLFDGFKVSYKWNFPRYKLQLSLFYFKRSFLYNQEGIRSFRQDPPPPPNSLKCLIRPCSERVREEVRPDIVLTGGNAVQCFNAAPYL